MRTLFYRLPRLTILAILITLIGGIGAILMLGRQEDPTLIERYGFVLTVLPGADAERMEALVSDPIEAALRELPELREVSSTSRAGVSQVSVEIEESLSAAEVDDAWTLIRSKVDQARAQLPAGVTVPEVERVYIGASTLLVSLVWEGEGEPELALMARMAENLEDRLANLPGTEETAIYGQPVEEIRVIVDPEALAAAGLNTRTAAALLAGADVKTPAGQMRSGSSNLGIEVGGEFTSISRIREVPLVQRPNGSAIRVGDVAQVTKGIADPQTKVNFASGQRAVTVGAFISPGLRVDQWAAGANAIVADFKANDASRGIRVETVFDQSNYTGERLNGLAKNLGFSALIVIGALFLCMGWRSAIVVGLALPLTICLVLILFNIFGQPLHQMSVTGLVISLGLLIDNAIVIADEFDQKRAKGYGRAEAIDASLKHLTWPLFASTLTTALAFAPIALLPGSAGEFVGMIGVSVIFSITTSFLVAITIIPALAGWLDRKRGFEGGHSLQRRWWRDGIVIDFISDGYRATVEAVLRFPPIGIVLGLAPAFLGFFLLTTLPSQFFPQTERDQFQVQMLLPPSASISETQETALAVTNMLMAYDEVEGVNWVLGEPSPRVYYNTVNNTQGVEGYAAGWVQLHDASETRRIITDVQTRLRREFPGAEILALPFEQGPPVDAPLELFIYGDDLAVLNRLGNEIRQVMASTPGVTYTNASLQLGAPKVTFRMDEAASGMVGEGLSMLAADLSAELEGVVAGSVQEGVESLPVRVIAPNDRRGGLDELRSKTVGNGAPLSALGELTLDPDTAIITRKGGRRVNQIKGFLLPYSLPAPTLEKFQAALETSGFTVPNGYVVSVGGEAEASGDALGNLAGVGIPLVLVMAGAIALVFNSFRLSLLILTVGGLSMGLAFFGVWLFNLPLGFNAIIGALGLLGIAINGSIVVLSMLRENPACRADDIIAQRETVVDATRHIVATTLTTMGGFVPLLLTGDAFWMPLAAGISGGVAGSAILALYFTPAVYRIMTMRPISRVLAYYGILKSDGRPPHPDTLATPAE